MDSNTDVGNRIISYLKLAQFVHIASSLDKCLEYHLLRKVPHMNILIILSSAHAQKNF